MKKSILLLGFCLSFVLSVFSQSVDQSGAFTYSVPIEVPPGTGGLTPQLSLSYNSNGGNGMCGVGWSLSGLSVITRDMSYPVTFTDTDHYLLDGQKLIETDDTGTYKEYRTERESFLHIRGYNLNTATSYWKVTAKNGQVMYYGRPDSQHESSNDGHIAAVGKSGKARVWSVSHVEDAKGNYYSVTYLEDDENGDYYPLQVIYTQNDADPLTSMRAVSFSYEERDDHYATYNPSKVDTDYRLKWISIVMGTDDDSNGGSLVRKYGLEYENGNSTGRSRITTIQPYGNDGNLPEVGLINSFSPTGTVLSEIGVEWDDSNDSFEIWSEQVATGRHDGAYTHYFGDVNGDGRTDLIQIGNSLSTWIGLADANGKFEIWSEQVATGRHDGAYTHYFGDVNGDGCTDLIQIGNSLSTWIGLADANGKFEIWSEQVATGRHDGAYTHYLGDVNGDGRTDLIQIGNFLSTWIGITKKESMENHHIKSL